MRIPPDQSEDPQVGSEPCDGVGNHDGEPVGTRECEPQEMQPRNISNPGAQDFIPAEGSSVVRAKKVERTAQPAGSRTAARAQEDGLVNRETLSVLRESASSAGSLEQGKPEFGHDAAQGVGGLNSSDDAGEREAQGPERAKAARAVVNFRRAT